jgi:hypothetical protein
MAIPQKFLDGNQPESHGIGINMIPGDPPTFQVELQRAPDDGSGGPGAFATIATLPPLGAAATYIDLLPNDNAFRHYRWRHIGPGYDPSPLWSPIARGKPVRLEGPAALGGLISLYPIVRNKPMSDGKYALKASDMVGKETDDDLFISTTKTLKVGTVASPGSLTKVLRFHCAELVPLSDIDAWGFSTGAQYVAPRVANTTLFLLGPLPIPKGVTLTKIRVRHFRASSSDVSVTRLYRRNSDDTTTELASITHASTGWLSNETSVSQLVGDEGYAITVELKGVSGALDAKWGWCEMDYTMPDYSKGY